MQIIILISVSFLLTFTVGVDLASCSVHYIVPTKENCSVETCLTISQFADNATSYIDYSNTTLLITGGNYYLDKSIIVSNTFQFSLLSANDRETFSVFRCSEDAGFTFYNISSILISGLTFMGCSNSRFDLVGQLTIKHSIFDGQIKGNTSVILNNSSANITATSFMSNIAGMLLENVSSQPHLLSTTATVGGALIITSNSDLTLDSCSFENNTANIGGAVFAESNSSISVRNSTFLSNHAKDCDNGLCYGGVLFIDNSGELLVDNCNFTQNSASVGGVFNLVKSSAFIANTVFNNNVAMKSGGVVYAEDKASIFVQNGTFISNSARNGGVMSISIENIAQNTPAESEVVINDSHFSNNVASNDGAVIISDGNDLTFTDSLFYDSKADDDGGVVHMRNNCTTEFRSCRFSNNSVGDSGGALYGRNYSTITIIDTNFSNCRANDSGGGVFIQEDSRVYVTNSTFTNNSADYGGALLAWRNSDVEIDASIFENNQADTDGGTLHVRIQSNLTVENCFFIRNKVINNGNIFAADSINVELISCNFTGNTAGNDGGSVYLYDNSDILLRGCNVSHSVSGDSGGAIYGRRNTSMMISKSVIGNNQAENSGGGVYAQQESFIAIEDCDFNNNVAEYGGAIRVYIRSYAHILGSTFSENSGGLSGGSIAIYKNSSTEIENSTFTNNVASFGSAVVAYTSNLTLLNSRIYNNRAQLGGAIRMLDANTKFSMCKFQGNTASSDGGVLYAQNTSIVIDTCMFHDNNAGHNGGVLYYSSSSQLTVNNSSFDQNRASYDGGVIYTSGVSDTNIDVGVFAENRAENSGGVIALLDQSNAIVTNCDFTRNVAVDAGGVINLQQSNVTVYSSTFVNSSTLASSGGVVHVHSGTLILRDSNFTLNRAQENGGVVDAHQSTNLSIVCSTFDRNVANTGHGGAIYLTEKSNSGIANSMFEENKAKKRGGGISLSILSKVSVTKSTFKYNTAQIGAALAAMQDSQISFNFKNQESISEQHNISKAMDIYYNKARLNGSIYLSGNSMLYIGEEANISHNNASMFGGGIYAIDSLITISNTLVEISSNQANFGGGLCLANSTIDNAVDDLDNVESVINFTLNKAEFGGAMYVDDDRESSAVCSGKQITDNISGCFFQDVKNGLMINLNNNSAKHGQDLFGGLLDRCTVAVITNSSKWEASGDSHFLSISSIKTFDTVSSKAVRVCICNENQPNCTQETHSISIRRGKINTFTLQLAAVDQVSQPVPAMISSRFTDDSISASQTVRASSTTCTDVEFQVSFPKMSKTVSYTLHIFSNGPCSDKDKSAFSVDVNVSDCSCPPGFMPQESSTDCRCICDQKLTELIDNLECNMTDESIIRESEFWVTFLGDNAGDNTSSPYSYFIYPHCPLDYCQPPSIPTPIKLSELDGADAQCVNNRSGLLCGSCRSNYSLSLGSSKCVKCPTNWTRYGLPVGIIVAALIAGVVLVVLILVLNLTVSVGTLNSIIFYVNIIDVNRSIYFGQSHLTFIPIYISWLNLDIGFDTCFIDGMDSYYKTWLRLAFPTYIIFIVLVIIWISSCSSKFSNLIGKKNPVATLATLILLSYTKLLQTIIVSFSFVYLDYPNETSSRVRWLPDASVEFAAGKHIGLICVTILILILGLMYTFLIFTWQWLLNDQRCKWTKNQKLHSFIDTYHNPHTMKHRYWTGLLLLVRIIVYIISAFSVSTDPRITLLSVVAIMSFLFLYKTTFIIRVYRNWLLNAMDSFVYFNIVIFTAFTWFTHDDLHNKTKEILQTFVVYISVGTVVILTLLIIIFHIYRYGNATIYSMGKNTKLAKMISANMSEDITQKDIWSRSRGTYKLFAALDDPRESSGYVPPPPLKATGSTVSIEECDEAPSSNAQNSVGKSSKKKIRAKTHVPKGAGFHKAKEFALLRKTESKLPFHNETTSNLLIEDSDL